MTKKYPRSSERGNVLFYILIAVALLAALSVAISQSGRGNINKLSEDKARLYATEILEYANIVASATAQLRLRGCDDDEISLENSVVAGYTNAGAPADNSCHIFHTGGGGVQWRGPETEWLDTTQSAETDYGNLFFPSTTCILNVGTNSATLCNSAGDDEELVLIMSWLKEEVCIQLNVLVGVDNPSDVPPIDTDSAWDGAYTKFTGSYSGDFEIGNEGTGDLYAETAGCFEGNSGATDPPQNTFHFYKVLIAR